MDLGDGHGRTVPRRGVAHDQIRLISLTLLPAGSRRLQAQRSESIDVDQGYRSRNLLGFTELAAG
jgi:hypothetical protein